METKSSKLNFNTKNNGKYNIHIYVILRTNKFRNRMICILFDENIHENSTHLKGKEYSYIHGHI